MSLSKIVDCSQERLRSLFRQSGFLPAGLVGYGAKLVRRTFSVGVYLGSDLRKEVRDPLRGNRVPGPELVAVHVIHNRFVQLPRHYALIRIGSQVHARHKQASAADICLEEHTGLAAQEPGVDGLYRRLEFYREIT